MKIIFDLDYTLLDTVRFKDALADIFVQENFYADYKKYFKDQGINFDPREYLNILKDEGKIDSYAEKEIKSGLKELLGMMDNYLFRGVAKILKKLKDGGAELILLTFGNKEWHEDKIRTLSIGRYFTQIVFEEEDKAGSEYLRSLKNTEEEVLIVNDNAKETEKMIKIIGEKAKVFLVDGPYVKNIKHNWPIHKLVELINYK
ncbi:MAG: hypothetical protein UU95_C0016G0012 [Parcubacteria group bacterium GW2011_GWC2_42_12]|uniref:FCP1 homology domain-containing protein n=1 Tax=Candidatus Falkowbacteria bacterium RIFCSPHIGHO2_02_FULL_42_9 TaxID=1797986 RepID=A0A1F5S8Y9_9BACT|nr:MAG: hypothetical protein UU95_C0016G0012 [Parcubacteria group bacterium GW2011_GWC2_42_12]OGF23188.1 MAG: hypothetical protein A3D45_01255 [Candidatus Falkowbacteria bacterium RIFCSPHIGHO2_02_FULL_42_9]